MMVFIAIGVIGAMLLLAMLLADDLWVDDDGETSKWVSPRAVAVFMTWFGAFGGVLYRYNMASFMWSSILAAGWSAVATGLVVSILNWSLRQTASTGTDLFIVGRNAIVTSSYRSGYTVVSLRIGELQQELIAKSDESLHEGDAVIITGQVGGVCLVKRQMAQ